MIFRIKNNAVGFAFPFIPMVLNLLEKCDKSTGTESSVIELNSIEDLVTLDSACRASDDTYRGLFITGNQIQIFRKGDFIE